MGEPSQIEILRHAIGIDRSVLLTGEPWRNRYVADRDSPTLRPLVDAGLMDRHIVDARRLVLYCATDAGIAAARDDELRRRAAAGLRVWIVTVDDPDSGAQDHQVLARSRGAATWDVIRDLVHEHSCDLAWCLEHVRARVAERKRRGAAP